MLGETIRELRKAQKKTQQQIADYLHINQVTYSGYETGYREPDIETIKKIASYYNVSVDYILGVEKEDNHAFDYQKYGLKPAATKKFRVLGNVACGIPIFAVEEHDLYIDADANIKADYVLIAKGDSMVGARICDGDAVFIRRQSMVNNGDIAAVVIGEEATLKRFYYYQDKRQIVLNAENPAYAPLIYRDKELEEIVVLGKAIAFQSNVR